MAEGRDLQKQCNETQRQLYEKKVRELTKQVEQVGWGCCRCTAAVLLVLLLALL